MMLRPRQPALISVTGHVRLVDHHAPRRIWPVTCRNGHTTEPRSRAQAATAATEVLTQPHRTITQELQPTMSADGGYSPKYACLPWGPRILLGNYSDPSCTGKAAQGAPTVTCSIEHAAIRRCRMVMRAHPCQARPARGLPPTRSTSEDAVRRY